MIDDRYCPKAVDREGTVSYVGVESLQRDVGVVDESVDAPAFPSQGVRQRRHAGRIDHV